MSTLDEIRRAVLDVPGTVGVELRLIGLEAISVVVDGGDDDAIALALARTVPAVTRTVGKVRVPVSIDGGSSVVAFDRPDQSVFAAMCAKVDRICGVPLGSTYAAARLPDTD